MKFFYKKKIPTRQKNAPTNQNQAVLTLLPGASKRFYEDF